MDAAPLNQASVASGSSTGPPQGSSEADGVWRLCLLGGLRLSDGHATLTRLPSRAVTALLARLALAPEQAHARETLIELLWPGVELDVGRNRLRQALSTLKSILEPASHMPRRNVLLADRNHVRVAPGGWTCDAIDFERAVRRGDHAHARALYGGDLLPGFYDEWIDDERLRLSAVHDRLGGLDAQHLKTPPAPPPALQRPAARIGARVLLPSYLTRMFGAEADATHLRSLVQKHRLVTLIGPGGSGKTRLAVEVAHSLRAHAAWPLPVPDPEEPYDLIVFVSLVACQTGAQAMDALTAALQIAPGARAPMNAVVASLHDRHALLLLDNFEQLVGDAEHTVAQLVSALPNLHVLVTSRRALGVQGEHEMALSPLALPLSTADLAAAAVNPAVALFVERAQAVRTDFHLGARNASTLVELVQELEGMPLAIELAASRVRSLSPLEMLQRLRGTGMPHLQLLSRSGAHHASDARHASMQRVIAWSWDQLETEQRRMLGALTVFVGGFTATAAQVLTQDESFDGVAALDDLLAHSLVYSHGESETLRFGVYQPVREFALQQMDAASLQHWRVGLRTWARAWTLAQPTTPSWPALRGEMPNLMAALRSAVEDGDNERAVEQFLAWRPWLEEVELPAQGLMSATAAVEACADPTLRARGHSALAALLFNAGQSQAALLHADLGVWRDGLTLDTLAPALHALANVRWRVHRNALAVQPLLDEAQGLAQQLGNVELHAHLLALRAHVAHGHPRDEAAAERGHAEALALWLQVGDQHAIRMGQYNLAVCAENRRQPALARERIDPLIAAARDLQDWHLLSRSLNVRGNALADMRAWPQALTDYQDCVQVAWRWTGPFDLAYGLWNMPRTLAHLRRPQDAVRLMAFAAHHWAEHFGVLDPSDRHYIRLVQRLCAPQITPASMAALWREGEHLVLSQAVSLALRP